MKKLFLDPSIHEQPFEFESVPSSSEACLDHSSSYIHGSETNENENENENKMFDFCFCF